MASDETIQQAAKVIGGILSADPQVAREMFGDEPDRIASALAEAGLLAAAQEVRIAANAERIDD